MSLVASALECSDRTQWGVGTTTVNILTLGVVYEGIAFLLKKKALTQKLEYSRLIAIMTEDTVFVSDGGGKVTAARYPSEGSQKVARFLLALRRSRLVPLLTSQLALC